MTKLKALFSSPQARLAARALAVGLGYFVKQIANGGPVTREALISAAVSAGWVAFEYFTPANGVLGYWKAVVKLDPALARFSPTPPPPQP